jgi:hypothetical protein
VKSKVWVLDTETKGTGAHVVPLETEQEPGRPAARPDAVSVPRPGTPREPAAPDAPKPHRFRVVDLMTRRVLADDADARGTVDALRDVRSVVDVDVFVSEGDDGDYRILSLPAQRKLWALGHPEDH